MSQINANDKEIYVEGSVGEIIKLYGAITESMISMLLENNISLVDSFDTIDHIIQIAQSVFEIDDEVYY